MYISARGAGQHGAKMALCALGGNNKLVLILLFHLNKLVLILTRHTLARAGLANRLLDRHEVVTIDGDVDTLGQATPTVTTANDKAFPRCSRQPRPARLPLEVASCARPAPTPCDSMAVDGARFVERGPCCRV